MRKIAFIIIAYSIFTLGSCRSTNKTKFTSTNNEKSIQENALAIYGEGIYNRESCSRCHTQSVEMESHQLISLDGIGGKYPNTWLYYYFLDPKIVKPDSKKSSFKHLYSNPLTKDGFSRIIKEKGIKGNKNTLWQNLTSQTKVISEELNNYNITVSNPSEIFALISYLQQIPTSKMKFELDSLENVKFLNKQKIWNTVTLDSTSIILEIANNPLSINKGKTLFKNSCIACHGEFGEGGIGPNLTDDYWINGSKKIDMVKTIVNGVPNKGMISWKNLLTPTEVGELVAYIYSLKDSNPKNAKAPQGKKE